MQEKSLDLLRYEFVANQLRRGHWEPIARAKLMSRTKRAINPTSGRLAWFHRCSTTHGFGCGQEFVAAGVQVDHVKPVVPVTGRTSIQELAERTLCDADGLQVLCKGCHGKKTYNENQRRLQCRMSQPKGAK